MLQDGTLTFGHAKAIMAIGDAATQIKVADEVLRRLMSVRETEAHVNRMLERPQVRKEPRASAGLGAEDPNVRAAEAKLRERLGTKVRIIRKGAHGRIEIEFYSDEELDRLFSHIMERGH
jgi:ParB family chromosome partitioning protein